MRINSSNEALEGVRRNATKLTAAKIVASAASAIWVFVAARQLPIDAFGDLALLLALGVIAVAVADLGLSIVVPELIGAQAAGPRHVALKAARLRAGSGAVASLVVGVAYLTVASDRSILIPLVFAGSIIVTAIHHAMAAALRAVGSVGTEAITDVGSRCLVLGAGWIVLNSGHGLLGVAAVYAIADVATVVVFTVVLRSRGDEGTLPPLPIRAIWKLALIIPFATVYWRLDVWLLAAHRQQRRRREYGAAYKLLDAGLLPPLALASLVAVRAARLASVELRTDLRRLCLGAARVRRPTSGRRVR